MEIVELRTERRSELVDVTRRVQEVVARSGVRSGIAVVQSLHTTAAITINENADPDVVHDMLLWLEEAIPQANRAFRHGEGNSDSHIKASLVGSSATVLIDGGPVSACTFAPASRNFNHGQSSGQKSSRARTIHYL